MKKFHLTHKILLLLVCFSCGASSVWAGDSNHYVQVTTKPSPSAAGTAYIGTNENPTSVDEVTGNSGNTQGSKTYYINAIPDANKGYSFANWTIPTKPGTASITDANSQSTSITVQTGSSTGDTNGYAYVVQANFKTYWTRLSSEVTPAGGGSAYVGTNSNPTSGTQVTKNAGDKDVFVELYANAVPNEGYTFTRWEFVSGDGSFDNTENAAAKFRAKVSNTPTVGDNTPNYREQKIRAVFTAKPAPTFYFRAIATPIPGSAGIAHVEPSQPRVQGAAWNSGSAQTTVTFTATPYNGFVFLGWSTTENGEIESTNNPYSKSITSTSTNEGNPTLITLYARFGKNPTGITANPKEKTLEYDGSFTVSYNITPADAYKKVVFSSSNPGVATVDANTGVVTAVSGGTANITVQAKNADGSNGPSDVCKVTVKDKITGEPAGYVIFNGSNYLNSSTSGTTTFNPSTCLWNGSSGSTFKNGEGYYLRRNNNNNGSFSVTKDNNANCTIRGTESGTTGQTIQVGTNNNGYLRFSNNSWNTNNSGNAGNVLFAVTKYTYPESKTEPTISGPSEISTLGKASFTRTDAAYMPKYYNYVFYNKANHYCLTETSDATSTKPSAAEFTYTWSLEGEGVGNYAVINSSTGEISYTAYPKSDFTATVKLTATSTQKNFDAVSQQVRFVAKTADPTSISASPTTVNVGMDNSVAYQLTVNSTDPAYNNVTATSSDERIFKITSLNPHNSGTVTIKGVAVGTATLTLVAKKKADGSEACRTSVTITVKDKVATPEITFTPISNTTKATATITCATEDVTIYYTTDGNDPVLPETRAASGTTKYTDEQPFEVENGTTVKAIAIKNDYDNSNVASATYNLEKVPTPEINIIGDRVNFSCDEPGVDFYYTTNGNTPTTGSTKWNKEDITNISDGTTIKVIATKAGFSNSEVATRTKSNTHVVYLDLSSGDDTKDGKTKANAVKTWGKAYEKLGFGPNAKYLRGQWKANGLTTLSGHKAFNNTTDADFTNTVDNNIIYLVGDVSKTEFTNLMGKTTESPTSETSLMEGVLNAGYFKPATISGKYANRTYANSNIHYARINLEASKNHTLNEDTRFEYIEFYGDESTSETQFMLAYYDLEMGAGITVQHMLSTKDFSTYHHGYAKGVTNTAHILFYGGLVCDKRFGPNANGEYNFDYYLPHPDGYKITIRSGYFSTISPGGKQWDNSTSLNGAMGSPNVPVKCTITVDVDRAWNDAHQTGVLYKTANGNPDCDVAVLIAGTHEGTMYGDVDIIVKSGRIDRVVNGTFGANNEVHTNGGHYYPADSYFGRANILIDPREPSSAERTAGYTDKNSMVAVRELYGGGLGRFKDGNTNTHQSATYFYGKSSVIINGGTFKSAIYASGAGGVNGVGDDTHHTDDPRLPYLDGTTIKYDSYANYKNKTKLYVKCLNSSTGKRENVDISETSTKIEIHGGVFGSEEHPIEGIFGGGYGFVDKELIDYTAHKPNTQAGSIFAAAGKTASSVTIDGDAIIHGNVYGAGRGDGTYYTSAASNKTSYNKLGLISGNVELNIGGNAQILGNVYGAGLGIENNNFTDMARLYGNTTLKVTDNAVIKGGVYGGGRNGSVDGNVDLSVLKNTTVGTSNAPANVHGGGYGKQTRVNGNVDVTVGASNDALVINGDVYGGSALGLTNGTAANTNYHTNVTLNAGTINGSLYGGGLGDANNSANVYAPVAVKVYGGSVKKTSADGSGGVYGANNINGAPQHSATVDIFGTDPVPGEGQYALYSVYGGGNKANYTYGNGYPKVTVHNCDNSIEYVYGGGNAAAVASTDVTIYGGNIIGNVFGGGNGTVQAANVTGNAKTTIHGGTILNVYGGSNTAGTIGGTISVTADEKGETGHDACKIHITDLYGGGNKAGSKAGNITIGCADYINTVYGGANQANINGDINLSITSGHINNVFGGNNNSGTISGGIHVTINDAKKDCGMVIGNVYGGGNLAPYTIPNDKELIVDILNATTTGNVFGGGKGSTAIVTGNPTVNIGSWTTTGKVTIGKSVFGGGDAANVSGTPVVNINTCGNTIKGDLYGGGNAADVTGTNVTMWGGTVMGNVFGGGNGKTEPGQPTNPGANINGNTNAKIYGGTIGTWTTNAETSKVECTDGTGGIFGGSNTKGNISGTANLTIDQKGYNNDDANKCDMHILEVYGAGNEAPFEGTAVNFTLGCVDNLDYVYGGAKKADLILKNGNQKGEVNLVITSGTFKGIFGGNNISGDLDAKVSITIDETGCKPVIIDEVYGGGNLADYEGDPKVKVISCTRIGTIFGGGKGKAGEDLGTVKGNPQVDIQMIKGRYAGKTYDGTAIPDAIGTIGNVFGGGFAAKVVGTPAVNIATEPTAIQHTATFDGSSAHTALPSANILGNVYGGGKSADVTNMPKVIIGQQAQ